MVSSPNSYRRSTCSGRARCICSGLGLIVVCVFLGALFQGCSVSSKRDEGFSTRGEKDPAPGRRAPNLPRKQWLSFHLLRTPAERLPLELRQILSSSHPGWPASLAQSVPNHFWPAWLLPRNQLLCLVAVFGKSVGETCARAKVAGVHGIFVTRIEAERRGSRRLYRLRGVGVAPENALRAVLKEHGSTLEVPVEPNGTFSWSELATESPTSATLIYPPLHRSRESGQSER